jgi:hypothetical protein
MNHTGAPCLLCLKYIIYVFNHTANKILEWKAPLQFLTGETTDISILLHFTFFDKVYISRTASDFPSDMTEEIGNFVGLKGVGLKGVGPITFHLGCDFNCDKDDGTLLYGPKSYIEKTIVGYKRMLGQKPKEFSSPLEKNDYPELDESDLLSSADITKYQSMVSATQWAISLGRFDIQTAVMPMSHFQVAPCIGHLDCMKRI